MGADSTKLQNTLKMYIDSDGADSKEEMRQLLHQTSSVDRYNLLMKVRGDKYVGNTGPHLAAAYNDLETLKYMLAGLRADQKYDVLKIKAGDGNSALHFAADPGYSSIITYLLTDLSQQQKFKLLKLQKRDGDTPLHDAASRHHSEAV